MPKNITIIENDDNSEDNDSSESNYNINEIEEVDNTEVEVTEEYNIIDHLGIIIEDTHTDNIEYIIGSNRISKNIITNFEAVRIIGERIKQLTMGAKPLVKNYDGLTHEEITIAEFKLKMCPFKIIRPLPNGKFELWNFDELSQDYLKIIL